MRLTMTWHPTDGEKGLRVLRSWADSLQRPWSNTCVWVSMENAALLPPSLRKEVCYHEFKLEHSLDRYVRVIDQDASWSPWGIKSGPNIQFFRVLAGARSAHPDDRVLLVEPDTYPFPELTSKRILTESVEESATWVLGARVHPWSKDSLAPFLHDHINGHASYLMSDEFSSFLEFVWMPSLLVVLRKYPEFAFDCLTPYVIESELPYSLRQDWQDSYHHFVTHPGFINASNMVVSSRQQLTQLIDAHLCDVQANPEGIGSSELVSLHVKGYPNLPQDLQDIAGLVSPS